MEALPLPPDLQPGAANAAPRVYVTCCVRLSTEKEPSRFVDLVAALQRLGTFDATGSVVVDSQTCQPPDESVCCGGLCIDILCVVDLTVMKMVMMIMLDNVHNEQASQ